MRQFFLCGFLASLVALATPGAGHQVAVAVPRNQPAPAPKAEVTPIPLGIGGALQVEPYKIVRLTAQGVPPKAGKKWKIQPLDGSPPTSVDWATGRNVEKLEWVAPPGKYLVTLTAGWLGDDGLFNLDDAEVVVTIGVPQPMPPGPAPPGPGPAPQPTPADGPLRVLFVFERGQNLTREQGNILNSTQIRAYLNAKANKGPDGRPEYRHWDDDVQFGPTRPDTQVMQQLWAAVKPKLQGVTLPVVAINKGTQVDVHPITAGATEQSVLELLKKYGG